MGSSRVSGAHTGVTLCIGVKSEINVPLDVVSNRLEYFFKAQYRRASIMYISYMDTNFGTPYKFHVQGVPKVYLHIYILITEIMVKIMVRKITHTQEELLLKLLGSSYLNLISLIKCPLLLSITDHTVNNRKVLTSSAVVSDSLNLNMT